MTLAKSGFAAAAFILVMNYCLSESFAQQTEANEVLSIGPRSEIRFASPWQVSGIKYANAHELVVLRRAEPMPDGQGAEQSGAFPIARILITTEARTSRADALKRLEAIAGSRDAPAEFIEVGGWPAVEVTFSEKLPRRGAREDEEAEAFAPDVTVQRRITAIAEGDKVVMFDASVLPDAPANLLNDATTIVRSVRFAEAGAPSEVTAALRAMRERETERQRVLQQRRGSLPNPGAPTESAALPSGVAAPVRVQGGFGELEIAASADATNVVIASNSALAFSTNRGANYTAGTTGVFGLNDPSLSRGASGDFYLAVIAFPTGTPAQLNVTGCTNAVSRSTNNGSSFGLQGYSAQCPQSGAGICFPDQEHITADMVNQTTNNDQVYAVWRNFLPSGPVATCGQIATGFPTSLISCSQNNGVTWTAAAAIPGAGDLPRVAVGRDGAVYAVTLNGNSVLLNRFTSCANGLTADAGFPVTVAILNGPVACPVSGLDRCNDGNTLSSPTVAPDPDDANHLFVAFAEDDGAGGERIISLESTDRGATFPNQTTVSNGTSIRRFMPWSCSTRARAWVGWYDRTAATAAGANNDLTDYFVAEVGETAQNLSSNPDPQCASGWPCAPRSSDDSESCPQPPPQLAGRCSMSGAPCDFSDGCPPGQGVCNTGGGCPKYGDYNGIACAGDYVFAAWASATAPAGLPPATGRGIYAATLFANVATIKSKTDPTLCMGVKHKVSEGANVQLYDCLDPDVHKDWNIPTSDRRLCQMGDGGTVFCIDFRAGAVDAVVTQEADFKNNQRWLFNASDSKFHNNDPNLCLDVESQSPNSQVKIFECAGFKKFQEWLIQ